MGQMCCAPLDDSMKGGVVKRKPIVGGNWKCNGSLSSIKDLVNNVVN